MTVIMASSLAGICTFCEWHCSNRQNTLASGWYRPRQRSTYSHAPVPARLLQASRVKSMLQHSYVYSTVIRSQLSPARDCVSWVHPTACLCMVVTINTAEKCVAPFGGDVRLENWVSQDTCCTMFSTYPLRRDPLQRACAGVLFHTVY
jgi:hypothetical protein